MKAAQVTEEWLKTQKFEITKTPIEGTIIKELNHIIDGRGGVIELWSKPWEGFIQPAHCYTSTTDYGVIKCWHLHDIHTDQFTVITGKLQVCLVDLREDSPTFGKANSIILGTDQPRLIKIPAGIMHGWKALSQPQVGVTNFQTHIYDPADEFKFTWDCVLTEIWEPKNG